MITRRDAPWERVKPISDGIKKKCELFAPQANKHLLSNAKITIEDIIKHEKAVENKILVLSTATEDMLEDEEVNKEEIVFTNCDLKSQDDLIKVNFFNISHQSIIIFQFI